MLKNAEPDYFPGWEETIEDYVRLWFIGEYKQDEYGEPKVLSNIQRSKLDALEERLDKCDLYREMSSARDTAIDRYVENTGHRPY